MINLEAVIYRHSDGIETAFELWNIADLPTEAISEIESILNRYNDRGFSVVGTAQEIANELV